MVSLIGIIGPLGFIYRVATPHLLPWSALYLDLYSGKAHFEYNLFVMLFVSFFEYGDDKRSYCRPIICSNGQQC